MTENEQGASVPAGWHTITPRIIAAGAERLVSFLRDVFGAVGEYQATAPTVLRIGDSVLMISEAGMREAQTALLYVYVGDVDATYGRALAAGAASIEAPFDTPYGERRAMVADEWRNLWQIATYAVPRRAI